MASLKKIALGLLVAGVAFSATGCAPVVGTASFTALSKDITADTKLFKPTGERIVFEECINQFLFFVWGSFAPNHESVLAQMLEETKADVILDAEVSTTWISAYVFFNSCAEISGIPAVRVMPGESGGFDNNSGSKWMEGK